MKLTTAQLMKIIKEEAEMAVGSSAGPADPAGFDKVYGLIKRLGTGGIPLEVLLELPGWFDAGADPSDTRMESAYRELIKTPVTIGHLDELVMSYHGA